MPTWQLDPYSAETLCARIAEYSSNTLEEVQRSLHAVYFKEYFAKLEAKTIVAELDYIDRDFLEDFAAYYVRCFQPYERACVRLHFFSSAITEDAFAKLFDGDSQLHEQLRRDYLGFIVLRRLPEHPIGRTCLVTYPSEGSRSFPITRTYHANLFGLELSVASLAFQEQDNVVAACATSALWSAFHGTGILFHHRIPSPIEITKSATAHVPDDTRVLPSSGLTTSQMADAIRACDLEPFMMRPATELDLKAAVRAYLLGKVPVLLVGAVFARDDLKKELGVHAVAVTGFGTETAPPPHPDAFCLAAQSITKLYCHDDRVGPFSRMEFVDLNGGLYLSTSSAPTKESIGSLVFRPEGVLVPLYHKVRVPYLRVFNEISVFDDYMRHIRSEEPSAGIDPVVWDLHLTTTNALKSEWLADAALGNKARRRLLEARLPKYIWLARGHVDGGPSVSVDLVFDATGLEAANLCIAFAERSTNLLSTVAAITKASDPGIRAEFPRCKGILATLAH